MKKVDCCIHVESSTNSDGKPEAKTWTTPHADIVKYSASTCSRDTTDRSYGRNASPVRARLRYTNFTGVWLPLRAKKLAASSPVLSLPSPSSSPLLLLCCRITLLVRRVAGAAFRRV